ncbi:MULTISPECIES: type VI secretion system baseplate subunit TssE [Pseudoalteromonas]|uniref:Type VI secretion protein n=4 Tax=Pseudoalteromonas luteoviolacea TaxID=43657 RepID=A0A023Q087_9GAMM|nr:MULTISPECIES: type VI secretion system baseplate subunit TssE [Pseudoalteromonas]AHX39918.1 hypothetical protein [Pseudoalteromonas luteoviolacea]AOT10931.1 type VI secretion protein [Pseudoalteromonas luteoviolacea]AOT15905.1 type VI secretion protein [Pseudoalteromonas luteoviolacea]AOT20752.1 type VI secretion protein [Pseudoalteromonas luteoviolacea]KID56054.1 type VI secretion protein [Pseudoalteromonas luteoviolacea]
MALFDLLAQSQQQAYNPNKTATRSLSVCEHLTQLLNARRGVLGHLEDYGLPDVEDIYEGLPYSQHTLANEVKKTIEKYEPRIANIVVRPVEIKEHNCVIRFDIRAELKSGEIIRLNTRFASGGKADVDTQIKDE